MGRAVRNPTPPSGSTELVEVDSTELVEVLRRGQLLDVLRAHR
jgi:hypothetical protein